VPHTRSMVVEIRMSAVHSACQNTPVEMQS